MENSTPTIDNPPIQTTPRLAPLGERTISYLVDTLILAVISNGITYTIFGTFEPGEGWPAAVGSLFCGLILNFIYAGYFYTQLSATPGKMLFNLKVVNLDGSKVSIAQGGLRDSLGKFVSGIMLAIGYIMAFFRQDRKALHDLMFNTKVIKA